MKNFFKIIRKSIFGKDGKESSTRINAYIILSLIIAFSILFIVLIICDTLIPNEALIIFGSLLAHHLTLLGINKNFEAKMFKINNNQINTEIEEVLDEEINDEELKEEAENVEI